MLVIRDALLSQLQKDRLRQEIILAELAKIEHAMVLHNDSRHGISTDDVEWTKPVPFTFREESIPHCRWSVSREDYADVDETYDPKKKNGRHGSVELKSGKPAMEYHVCECLRPCCNGKAGQENAKLEEQKLQESSETIQPKKTLPSVKWEMTEITIPVKKPHWELTCDICQVQATSEHSFQEHCVGQKHRSNLATVELRNKVISQKAQLMEESSSFTEQKISSIRWSCSTCQVNGSSESDLKEHVNGPTHQQNIEDQHVESKGVAKKIELQEAKLNKSNTPQHAEKPPPGWSCSICQANCARESDLRHLLAKIEALLDEINNMHWKPKSQEAMVPPTIVPQHAQQASGSNCSISHAGSEYQLNIQALNKEAKDMEKLLPQTAKNQQPPSGWDCGICQAKCYSESQFVHHCRGRKHQKKIEALQGEGENAKSSNPMVDDKVHSNSSDSNSSTLEKVEELTSLYSCEVGNEQCNSEGMLADHCNKEHMEAQEMLNFCEICSSTAKS
ncbi:uncharacterized protein LOC120695673 isoform X2 [Panicum virgatum]|nr:uncharacterized protein LOC120695673 isoform X2 [Panicum virgatum]XP_039834829.1 uncharacterized protein LOC120695673 isoform X2 [Panicum virgatum]KAG2643483.1 hypothetical protein PVAP13_2KG337900 [Panicum virgatum]KAG2643484.1 hypothetical protein PVAP13_2KG337900 [Panicum virgatum]